MTPEMNNHLASLLGKGMGAAFPIHGQGERGISKREYFAAHAPGVPDWFRYQADGKPSEGKRDLPEPEKELTSKQQEEVRAWKDGLRFSFDNLSEPVREFLLRYQRIHEANEKFHAWHMRCREEKYWAWRFYYADMMIKGSQG